MENAGNGTKSSETNFFSDKSVKVFVAGHRGLVGFVVLRRLVFLGFTSLLVRLRTELDLTCQSEVESFFAAEGPHYIVLCAAKSEASTSTPPSPPTSSPAHPAEYLQAGIYVTESSGPLDIGKGRGKQLCAASFSEAVLSQSPKQRHKKFL